MHYLTHYIGEGTRVKNCPELLAVSLESREMPLRPSDNADMAPIAKDVVKHKNLMLPSSNAMLL